MTIATKQIDCPRCKGYVVIPVLSPEERVYVGAELRKLAGPISWIQQLRNWAEMSLADGKRFTHHFSPTKGICSWCRKELPEHSSDVDHIICPHCQSLNLDW